MSMIKPSGPGAFLNGGSYLFLIYVMYNGNLTITS